MPGKVVSDLEQLCRTVIDGASIVAARQMVAQGKIGFDSTNLEILLSLARDGLKLFEFDESLVIAYGHESLRVGDLFDAVKKELEYEKMLARQRTRAFGRSERMAFIRSMVGHVADYRTPQRRHLDTVFNIATESAQPIGNDWILSLGYLRDGSNFNAEHVEKARLFSYVADDYFYYLSTLKRREELGRERLSTIDFLKGAAMLFSDPELKGFGGIDKKSLAALCDGLVHDAEKFPFESIDSFLQGFKQSYAFPSSENGESSYLQKVFIALKAESDYRRVLFDIKAASSKGNWLYEELTTLYMALATEFNKAEFSQHDQDLMYVLTVLSKDDVLMPLPADLPGRLKGAFSAKNYCDKFYFPYLQQYQITQEVEYRRSIQQAMSAGRDAWIGVVIGFSAVISSFRHGKPLDEYGAAKVR